MNPSTRIFISANSDELLLINRGEGASGLRFSLPIDANRLVAICGNGETDGRRLKETRVRRIPAITRGNSLERARERETQRGRGEQWIRAENACKRSVARVVESDGE